MTYEQLQLLLVITWSAIIIYATYRIIKFLEHKVFRKRYNLEMELQMLVKYAPDEWTRLVISDALGFISAVIDLAHRIKENNDGE